MERSVRVRWYKPATCCVQNEKWVPTYFFCMLLELWELTPKMGPIWVCFFIYHRSRQKTAENYTTFSECHN